jgi:PTS system cellobiose-specific IIC component
MLRSRSAQLRTVGKVALGPAIFNINEPVTFGVLMMLNPIMMIPFVLVPVTIVTINYLVFAFNLVHVPVVIQPFTVPIGLSGFVATGGDIRGSVLQFFDLAVAAIMYYPFFKTWERILVEREEAQQDGNQQAPITHSIRRSTSKDTASTVGARKEAL